MIGSDHVPQRAMIDFNDPEQRLDYLLHHGVDAYNKAMEDHFAKVVETVNGHAIRLVHSMRFGALYTVDDLHRATRPWTAPARSREVKHDRALSRDHHRAAQGRRFLRPSSWSPGPPPWVSAHDRRARTIALLAVRAPRVDDARGVRPLSRRSLI